MRGESADTLLCVGSVSPELCALLSRLGYNVVSEPFSRPVPEIFNSELIDLVLLSVDEPLQEAELCRFLRSDSAMTRVPLLCLSRNAALPGSIAELPRVEVIDRQAGAGIILGRIATQLRMSKVAGQDERTASAHEVAARYRELGIRTMRELEEAREIQEALLPRVLPGDDRFEVAVSYEPLERVGGDWYYAHRQPDGRVCLQIADITGHGLSAALVSSMTKLASEASAENDPVERVRRINALLTPQLPEARFVTFCCAAYDPLTGDCTVARAGHPAPLMVSRTAGKVERLKPSGMAIGFMDDGMFASQCVRLDAGDMLLLYTDGLYEAADRFERMFGLERVEQALLAVPRDASAGRALEILLEEFDRFMDGKRLVDDVTLLLLKRKR